MLTKGLFTAYLVILISMLIAPFPSAKAEEFIREIVVDVTWGDGPGQVGIGSDVPIKSGPNDFTIDNDGNIYVMDTVNKRLNKYSSEGTFLFSINVNGSNLYVDVDSNGEKIYVAGDIFDPVKAFNREGKLLWQLDVGEELSRIGHTVTQYR